MVIRNRRFKIFIWITSVVVFASLCFWIFIKMDDKALLGYGALHVSKLSGSVKIIDYATYGASDFAAQYYISVNPADFTKLLVGRKYTLQQVTGKIADVRPLLQSFPATKCYSSGALKEGLVRIYTNADSSKAFIFYEVD